MTVASTSKMRIASIACSTYSLFICSVVIYGWLTANYSVVQIAPDYPAMQFNTAVCLGLLSIAVILARFGLNKVPVLLACIAAAIGFLVIADHSVNANVVGELFFRADSNSPLYPIHGKMANNSALAIVCLSSSIILIRSGYSKSREIPIILSCVAFALGAVSTIGYFLAIASAYKWSDASGMAFKTALCCLLLGIATMLNDWE